MKYLRMFFFTCALSIVFVFSVLAQQTLTLEYLKKKEQIISFIDTLIIVQTEKWGELKWEKNFGEDCNRLDFGLKYLIDREEVNRENYYTLMLWQNKKMIYGEIFTITENYDALDDDFFDVMKVVETKSMYRLIDSLAWQKVQQQYQNIYGTPMDIEGLKKHANGFRYPLGYAFGGGAEPNEQGQYLIKLVKAKNKSEILRWATSLVSERQAYGYIGLLLLQKKGIALTPNELKIMQHILNKTSLVEYGYGCTGQRGLMTMKEALDEEMLKEFLQGFAYYLK